VELQGLTTQAEARQAEIARLGASVAVEAGTDGDLLAALQAFDPLWDTLTPREQARGQPEPPLPEQGQGQQQGRHPQAALPAGAWKGRHHPEAWPSLQT
jgi:hypothetical protein